MQDDEVQTLMESVRDKTDAFEHKGLPNPPPPLVDVGGREHFKDFRKVVSLADVIIQVLDARDPQGCRSNEVEHLVRQCTPQKRLVFLLNKTDLVPRENIEAWLKHLRQFAPTIAFKCSTQRQSANLGQSKSRLMESKSSVCLGADNLIQLLKNYTRNADIRTSITVGLVGVPNVGKSSVINSLKRSRATNVGNRAGVTTNIQEVHLDKQIRLLDSPGVIYDKGQGTLQGVVNIESIPDPVAVVEQIAEKVKPGTLLSVYGIDSDDSAQSILKNVAEKTGKLKKGGLTDVDAAAKIIIQDWNNGKIPFLTQPPMEAAATEVKIVDDWGKLFSLDGLEKDVGQEDDNQSLPPSESMEEKDTLATEAVEAFAHMSSFHQTRSEVNRTAEALTDLNILTPKKQPTESTPTPETISLGPPLNPTSVPVPSEVQVLYRRHGVEKKPANSEGMNLTSKRNQKKKIRKKKSKKKKRKMKVLKKVTDSMANDLKL